MSSARQCLFERDQSPPLRPAPPASRLPRDTEMELPLLFQPMMSLSRDGSRQCRHVDALMRWNHPRHGLLLPQSFLGLVERADAMQALAD